MTADELLIAERTQFVMRQWPHMRCVTQHVHEDACRGDAYGCLNCNLIFSSPVRTAMRSDTDGRCPGCSSESVFDVAAALAIERTPLGAVLATVGGMIKQLDLELVEPRQTEGANND